MFAWCLNGFAFVFGYFTLSYLLLTTAPVDAVESAAWAANLKHTFIFSLAQTWLLLDLIKVLVATALSAELTMLVLSRSEAERQRKATAEEQKAQRLRHLAAGHGSAGPAAGKLDAGGAAKLPDLVSTHLGSRPQEGDAAEREAGAEGEEGGAVGSPRRSWLWCCQAGRGVLPARRALLAMCARAGLSTIASFAM